MKIFRSGNVTLFISLIVYVVSGVILLKYYQYAIGADGISYISIAQKYLSGNFKDGVNGYWGPFFSWLLIPFLSLGLEPLLAAKILALALGLIALIGVSALSLNFEISAGVRSVIMVAVIPVILQFALSEITPDLLLLCILLFYLNLIFNKEYSSRPYAGLLCGLAGSLAYLSKSYALPFFVSHFLLFTIFHFLKNLGRESRILIARNYILGMILFSIISGAWIYMLSSKYGTFTIGTTASYNRGVINPDFPGHPMHTRGLLPPPNPTALSAWEDPSYLPLNVWSPFQSFRHFRHQVYIVIKNLYVMFFKVYPNFTLLSLTIVSAYILLCVRRFAALLSEEGILFPLATFLLMGSGYLTFFVMERFLYINDVLLLIMGGYLLTKLFQNGLFDTNKQIGALAIFGFSFVVYPVTDLVLNLNTGKNIYELSRLIKNNHDIQGKVASNNKFWHYSLFLSYYLHTPYFGETLPDSSDASLVREFQTRGLDYYFVWNNDKSNENVLSHYRFEEVKLPGTSTLRIYALK